MTIDHTAPIKTAAYALVIAAAILGVTSTARAAHSSVAAAPTANLTVTDDDPLMFHHWPTLQQDAAILTQ
jgi:hypothetical protein